MKFKVQKCVALNGKLESGVRVGRVWQNVVVCKRQAVAERLAQYQRQDLRHQRPFVDRPQVRIAT